MALVLVERYILASTMAYKVQRTQKKSINVPWDLIDLCGAMLSTTRGDLYSGILIFGFLRVAIW